MKKLAQIIGSFFGTGFSPIAPGTVGSLCAIIILWFVNISFLTLLLFSILFFIIGVWVSTICEKEWGHDPGRVNWDEVVGMIVSVSALPKHWLIYSLAFILFRLFDILKPFPANVSQKLKQGWGVMTDDIVAAVYTNILLQIFFRFIFKSLS